jgi:hypothetical protein
MADAAASLHVIYKFGLRLKISEFFRGKALLGGIFNREYQ